LTPGPVLKSGYRPLNPKPNIDLAKGPIKRMLNFDRQ
jgi:hypothetical protein